MAKNPRRKARKQAQRKYKRYAKNREDLQLAGKIATVPEGAVARPNNHHVQGEVVRPEAQDEQRFPGLDRLALRQGSGFDITEPVARKIVEVNAEALYERRTYYDKDGREIEAPPDRMAQVQASKVLLECDKRQWERDHPEQARGGTQVNVGVQVNNVQGEIAELMRRVEAQKRVGKELENAGHVERESNRDAAQGQEVAEGSVQVDQRRDDQVGD